MNRKRAGEVWTKHSHRLAWCLLWLNFGLIVFSSYSFISKGEVPTLMLALMTVETSLLFFVIIKKVFSTMALLEKPSKVQAKTVRPLISKAPGSRLLTIVQYLYYPKTVEEVFKPLIADWRTEYFDALKAGKNRKASWINIRYIISFGMAMGLSKILSVIRSVAHR
jgi:hypothetical protein